MTSAKPEHTLTPKALAQHMHANYRMLGPGEPLPDSTEGPVDIVEHPNGGHAVLYFDGVYLADVQDDVLLSETAIGGPGGTPLDEAGLKRARTREYARAMVDYVDAGWHISRGERQNPGFLGFSVVRHCDDLEDMNRWALWLISNRYRTAMTVV